MTLHRNDNAVRIGPITVITLIIVIALATLSVLSLTTARAARVAADKQDASVAAFYSNESAAQRFLADLDSALVRARTSGLDAQQAAREATRQDFAQDASADGALITKTFTSEGRALDVCVEVLDDLTVQVRSWTTHSTTDTSEKITLWQGNAGRRD